MNRCPNGEMRGISTWIETPNLPKTQVTLAAVANHPDLADALQKRGVEPVIIRQSEKLDVGVSNHPDMLLYHLGVNRLLYGDEAVVPVKRLVGLGFSIQYYDGLRREYPGDIALNCARVGNFLFCLEKHTAIPVLNECRKAGIKVIPVRQGYAKCSVCVVSEHALITADSGIYSAAIEIGLDALLIRPGHIRIGQYGYGFLGGCCGKLAPDMLVFSGNLRYHPDETEIRRFLLKNGVTPVFFSKEPLLDIGGILPLMQG